MICTKSSLTFAFYFKLVANFQLKFEPGNIINEYALPLHEKGDTEERWVSSYIIVAVDREVSEDNLTCVCIFDLDEEDDHSPGLTIHLDFGQFCERAIKWRETQIAV